MNNDIVYISRFFSKVWSEYLFSFLLNHINWHNELKTTSGEIKKIKRRMAYVYDKKIDYKYANFILPGEVWTTQLVNIRDFITNYTGHRFNSVLLNLYENGSDEIKWHSDNEKQLGENPVIAMLSLGDTRTFHMLNKESGLKLKYPQHNGDLLVMKENCQKNWLHAILPEKNVGPRISLTFRWVYDDFAS